MRSYTTRCAPPLDASDPSQPIGMYAQPSAPWLASMTPVSFSCRSSIVPETTKTKRSVSAEGGDAAAPGFMCARNIEKCAPLVGDTTCAVLVLLLL